MRNLPLFFSTAILILVVTSCRQQRYIYAASKLNTPMLKQKGDARLNASFSFGSARGPADSSGNNGVDLLAAYAISKSVGLMASYYQRNEKDKFDLTDNSFVRQPFDTSFIRYSRRMFEVGAGGFSASGDDVFSFYGGIAVGNMRINDAGLVDSFAYTRNFSAGVFKFFLQPGFSHVSREHIRLDLSLRVSLLKYHNIKTNYTQNEQDLLRLDGLENSPLLCYVEPSFVISFPFGNVKWLYIETGMSGAIRTTYHDIRKSNFFVGLTANPVQAFRRK